MGEPRRARTTDATPTLGASSERHQPRLTMLRRPSGAHSPQRSSVHARCRTARRQGRSDASERDATPGAAGASHMGLLNHGERRGRAARHPRCHAASQAQLSWRRPLGFLRRSRCMLHRREIPSNPSRATAPRPACGRSWPSSSHATRVTSSRSYRSPEYARARLACRATSWSSEPPREGHASSPSPTQTRARSSSRPRAWRVAPTPRGAERRSLPWVFRPPQRARCRWSNSARSARPTRVGPRTLRPTDATREIFTDSEEMVRAVARWRGDGPDRLTTTAKSAPYHPYEDQGLRDFQPGSRGTELAGAGCFASHSSP